MTTQVTSADERVIRELGISIYDVEWEAVTEILGTRPKHPDILRRWLEEMSKPGADELEALAKAMPDGEEGDAQADRTLERELARWTGFPSDPETGELFIYNYQIVGALKEWANKYRDNFGIRNMRAKVAQSAFVEPRCVMLGKMQADTVIERPLRASTPKGDRVALVKSDALAIGTRIRFQIHLVPHGEIKPTTLEKLMLYGRYAGTFQWRTGGHGQVHVISFAKRR